MKKFVLVAVLATAVYFLHRRSVHETAPDVKTPAATKVAAPITPRPVYEHDWAKHSLDRAHAVVDEVQQSRQEDAQP